MDFTQESKAIGEAREKGDLKENAEYDAAKEAQGILEAKIKQLEGIIATARIVDENPRYLDATDALAVAVCHHFQGNSLGDIGSSKLSGWKDFLVQNPGRIKRI